MSQHDYNLANQSRTSYRSDHNNLNAAILSQNSGASAPTTTAPYMLWPDTTTATLKRRNAADSGWIVRDTLDEAFVIARSSNTILDNSDISKTIVATSTFTQTLTAAATLGDGWHVYYRNDGTGNITIDPDASELIDGAATLVLGPGESCRVNCNGSAFKTIGLPSTGTWTPAFTSTDATFAYTQQIGLYAKFGKIILLEFRLLLNGAPGGTTTNSVFISGIPFTCATLSNLFFGGHLGHYNDINITTGSTIAYQGGSGGTTFELKVVGDNLAETAVLASALGTAAEIRGTIMYISA